MVGHVMSFLASASGSALYVFQRKVDLVHNLCFLTAFLRRTEPLWFPVTVSTKTRHGLLCQKEKLSAFTLRNVVISLNANNHHQGRIINEADS